MTGSGTSGFGGPDIFDCGAGHDTDSGQYNLTALRVNWADLVTGSCRTICREP